MSRDWLCGRQTLAIDRDKSKVVTLSEITQTPEGKYRMVCLHKVPMLMICLQKVPILGARGRDGKWSGGFPGTQRTE